MEADDPLWRPLKRAAKRRIIIEVCHSAAKNRSIFTLLCKIVTFSNVFTAQCVVFLIHCHQE